MIVNKLMFFKFFMTTMQTGRHGNRRVPRSARVSLKDQLPFSASSNSKVVYHASSYLKLVEDGVVSFGDQVDVCVPTGNFGNALAAVYAKVFRQSG